MAPECPNCETKTASHATEYVETGSAGDGLFLKKRLREAKHCPFCGAELPNA